VKAEEIRHALVMVARGFPNHPDVLSFADKLAEVCSGWVAPPECSDCNMPGGEHMRYCPNNPLPLAEQDVIGAKVEGGALVPVRRAKSKKAD
jgi:hypothetical protein